MCLLSLSNLNWPTPNYTKLCRRQQHLQVNNSYRPNPNGLHFLVDSTGVKMLGEDKWKTKKHGADIIGDTQSLPDMLNQIPLTNTSIQTVSTLSH